MDMVRKCFPFVLSFILGLLACLGLAPYHLWGIGLAALTAFFMLMTSARTPKEGSLCAFSFALGYFLLGLYWIGNAVFIHWDQYWWIYPLAVIGLPLLLATFWGIAGWVCVRFSAPQSLSRMVLYVLAFSLEEWIRGWIFTGFPWNLPGYFWASVLPVAQTASLFGIYGLTAITFAVTALLGYSAVKRVLLPALIGFILIICAFLWGSYRLEQNPVQIDEGRAFLIVQPNIPQTEKWDPDYVIGNIRVLLDLSRFDPSSELSPSLEQIYILWPETALSQGYFDHPAIRGEVINMLQSWPVPAYLLTGIIRKNGDLYYNSIFEVEPDSGAITNTYDKRHLVPFGEYIPFVPADILAPMNIVNFTAGPKEQAFQATDFRLMPLICYEAIFPHRSFSRDRVDAMIVSTNDAWYNDAPGPYQHHVMAGFRAIEQGVSLYRSANTGISGAYDSFGRKIIADIGYNIRDSRLVYTPKSLNKKTIFSKSGNIIFFSTMGFLYFLFMVLKKKQY